MIEKPEPSTR